MAEAGDGDLEMEVEWVEQGSGRERMRVCSTDDDEWLKKDKKTRSLSLLLLTTSSWTGLIGANASSPSGTSRGMYMVAIDAESKPSSPLRAL